MITLLSRVGQTEHTDCGTEDPTNYPDAGVFPDASAQGDGGGNGLDSYTGSACLCEAGISGAASVAGVWLLAAAAAVFFVLFRKRSKRS